MSLQERSRRERALQKAAASASACRLCAIGGQRRNNVYGEGDPCARLMVVGEGPGETEDLLGRPFVGRAGQLLDKMLGAIDLPREDVYICNTVKCRPTMPGERGPRNRAPEPLEMSNCRPFLDEQIEIVRPAAILALGAPAAKSFRGGGVLLSTMRGRWWEGPRGGPGGGAGRPAYLLRQTGGELEAVKRLVWSDLKAIRTRLAEIAEPVSVPAEQATLFGD